MRSSWLLSLQAALLLTGICSFAAPPTPVDHEDVADLIAQKTAGANPTAPPDPIYVDVGGDTIGSATLIPAIPYSDNGNTCQFTHNYDAVCPFNLPGAPDVVYRYTPSGITHVSIDLCGSDYDTKVYVYSDVVGDLVACNDDACGPDGYRSELESVMLSAGHTYYIVVDGWSANDCGNYALNVSEQTCYAGCPGGILEGEPVCHDGYVDAYNGGCSSTPPVFTSLPCSDSGETTRVCGEYGGFSYFYRDTDWYQIQLSKPSEISWCVFGESATLVGIIDGTAGCPVTTFYDYNYGDWCGRPCVTASLPIGTWWLFVAPSGFGPSAGPCGSNYIAELTGYDCGTVAVEAATWGGIKNLYR